MDIKLQLGIRIKKFRKKMSFSQERLAELSGLDRTYISGIERGTRNPSIVNIQKISKALKVKLSELFSEIIDYV